MEYRTSAIEKERRAIEHSFKQGRLEDAAERARALDRLQPTKDAEWASLTKSIYRSAWVLDEPRHWVLDATPSDAQHVRAKLRRRIADLSADPSQAVLTERVRALLEPLSILEKRGPVTLPKQGRGFLESAAESFRSRSEHFKCDLTNEETMLRVAYLGRSVEMGYLLSFLENKWFLQAGVNRFTASDEAMHLSLPCVVTQTALLGEAMERADVWHDGMWEWNGDAPFAAAWRSNRDGTAGMFLNDRLYTGHWTPMPAEHTRAERAFTAAVEELATAITNDPASTAELRSMLAFTVRAAAEEAEWHDHQPRNFARRVLDDGYVEKHLPGASPQTLSKLSAYRAASAAYQSPVEIFRGVSAGGDEAIAWRTPEGRSHWRLYDRATDQTTFATSMADDSRRHVFALYDYPGKLEQAPADTRPLRVRMSHPAVGVTAVYNPATGTVRHDPITWNRAVLVDAPYTPAKDRATSGYDVAWAAPPHALLTDDDGRNTTLVTPFGAVRVEDFRSIADPAERRRAMDAYLDRLAAALPTAPYIHLFSRYAFEYVNDSPLAEHADLLGSRARCGDIHQTTYQSLQRIEGGRYVGDCDDLAELFHAITRRQKKLSFVISLPRHAACCWVEKEGVKHAAFVVDTGQPRVFRSTKLNDAIKAVYSAYTDPGMKSVDTTSLGFLFRFNGEPTRTAYQLSSRMFVDGPYAAALERVQEDWHFHFYANGIRTMRQRIESGDGVPENWVEIAGLYGRIGESAEAERCLREALLRLTTDQIAAHFDKRIRIVRRWAEARNPAKALAKLDPLVGELEALQKRPNLTEHTPSRMEVATLLVDLGKPWDAWKLLRIDMITLAQKGEMQLEHAAVLIDTYRAIKDWVREGKPVAPADSEDLKVLEQLLEWYYRGPLFEKEDRFRDTQYKTSLVADYFAGRYGRERLIAELLKDGPLPARGATRKGTEDDDWKWIRISVDTYAVAIHRAVDFDKSKEEWRIDEAVRLAERIDAVAKSAGEFGSLSDSQLHVYSAKIIRGFARKDWPALRETFKAIGSREWRSRSLRKVTNTISNCAQLVTPDEFKQQIAVYFQYVRSRPNAFLTVYTTYRACGRDHALKAMAAALETWSEDEGMKREAELFEGILAKKLP